MRGVLRALYRGALSAQLRLRGGPTHYVLVLGHMRAGTTLLAHILMSHPAILGCGERNQPTAARAISTG